MVPLFVRISDLLSRAAPVLLVEVDLVVALLDGARDEERFLPRLGLLAA